MEVVVANSDIARLVLSYLKDQGLEQAARIFCQTSPHLKQDFLAFKKGLQLHSFYPEFEQIIIEYVKIKRKVNEVMLLLPAAQRSELQPKQLFERISDLLDYAVTQAGKSSNHSLSLGSTTEGRKSRVHSIDAARDSTLKHNQRRQSADVQTNSLLSNRENGALLQKRKRTLSPPLSSAVVDIESRKMCASQSIKRRRVLEPFCYLNAAAQHSTHNTSKSNEQSSEDSADNDEDVEEEFDETNTTDSLEQDSSDNSVDHSVAPCNESTPYVKSFKGNFNHFYWRKLVKLLEKKYDFPNKLAKHINEVREVKNAVPDANAATTSATAAAGAAAATANLSDVIESATAAAATVPLSAQDQQANKLIDEVMAEILAKTENDPSFEHIVYEIMKTCSKTAHAAAVQCNLPETCENTNTNNAVPSTPITHRPSGGNNSNAVAAAPAAAAANANNEQDTTFGSLIDPNFSISKLILLNPNESAQKQQTMASIGNQTADQLLNQLAGGIDAGAPTVNTQPLMDDQVLFDANTGQLTFPVFFTNEGVLSTNFPFLLNNELITHQLQQQQPSNVCLDNSRIEIPLAEPIIVSADQLPPNAIIVSSTQKLNTNNNNNAEQQKPEMTASKIPMQDVTPSTSSAAAALHNKTFLSLSTPRKRTTHVRNLTFSPNSCSKTGTSLNTPKDIAMPWLTRLTQQTKEKALNPPVLPVETLESVLLPDAGTDSSNSLPTVFANEDCSNQTVIRKESAMTMMPETPKLRQKRRVAAKACKRQLSKSSNEEEATIATPTKKEQTVVTSKKDVDSAELLEWQRMRHAISTDFEGHLREVNAKCGNSAQKKQTSKKCVRRRKNAETKRKEIEAAEQAAKELEVPTETTAATANEPNTQTEQPIEDATKTPSNRKKRNSRDKSKEVGIKIPTPKKSHKSMHAELAIESKKLEQETMITTAAAATSTSTTAAAQDTSAAALDNFAAPALQLQQQEYEKRTNNIAFLLETPFKDGILANVLPPTPGVFAAPLETPLAKKIMTGNADLQQTMSYLFGSAGKSELGTPCFGPVITPGMPRFTPYGKDSTPHSVAATDYSSGSSYYKPDESDELNRQFDKMLEMQRQDNLQANIVDDLPVSLTQTAQVVVPISAQKLKVEPNVLKRVKSFNETSATNAAADAGVVDAAMEPHYNLADELPDVMDDENSSSSSSNSSASTSNSSSRSSSSHSSSGSSNSSARSKQTQHQQPQQPETTSTKAWNFDDLSEISSAEDEDWNRPNAQIDENSQLINQEGEVRYPVRSWMTPSKTPAEPIQLTVPVKSAASAAKVQRYKNDLEQKRERVKKMIAPKVDKKKQTQIKVTNARNAALAHKRQEKLRAVTLKAKQEQEQKEKEIDAKAQLNRTAIKSAPPLDVLNALHLSAKKPTTCTAIADDQQSKIDVINRQAVTPIMEVAQIETFKNDVVPPKKPFVATMLTTFVSVDDNAISNVFAASTSANTHSTSTSTVSTINFANAPSSHTSVTGKNLNAKNVTVRKTQIKHQTTSAASSSSSLTLTKLKRANCRTTQKLSRTPLNFKRMETEKQKAAEQPTTSTAASTTSAAKATKPKAAPKKNAAATTTLRVSPRLSAPRNAAKKENAESTTKSKRPLSKAALAKQETALLKKKEETLKNTEETAKLALMNKSKITSTTHTTQSKCIKNDVKQTNQTDMQVTMDKPTETTLMSQETNVKENTCKPLISTLENEPAVTVMTLQQINEVAKPVESQVIESINNDYKMTIVDVDSDDNEYWEWQSCNEIQSCVWQGKDDEILLNVSMDITTARQHLAKYQMTVDIDDDETHSWQISNEIELFENKCINRTIRNIPKKRVVRVSSIGSNINSPTPPIEDTNATIAKETTASKVGAVATANIELDIDDILSKIHGT